MTSALLNLRDLPPATPEEGDAGCLPTLFARAMYLVCPGVPDAKRPAAAAAVLEVPGPATARAMYRLSRVPDAERRGGRCRDSYARNAGNDTATELERVN